MAEILFFLFGLSAGFVFIRLRRRAPLAPWERKLLRPLGWVLMVASLTLAAVLIGWAAVGFAIG